MGWARFQALGYLPNKADTFLAYTQVKTSPENICPVPTTCQALYLVLHHVKFIFTTPGYTGTLSPSSRRESGTQKQKDGSETQSYCPAGSLVGPLLGEAEPRGAQVPALAGAARPPSPAPPPGTEWGSELQQLGDARPHTAHTQAFVLRARAHHKLPW